MNKKQWTGLLMIYVSYLFLGATIFYFMEHEPEYEVRAQQFRDYNEIQEILAKRFSKELHDLELFRFKLSEYCGGKTFEPNKTMDDVIPVVWDYYNSFFFVITVVSTIGYGNFHPSTDIGRLIMIFYAIVGMPLNGILLTSLGQFFGAVFLKAHRRYKNQERYDTRCSLAVDIFTYLVPGIIVFIFLPAGVITYFENWTYIESVYYAFVTLTTIGFGDLVAGQQQYYPKFGDAAVIIYKILIFCWILFGLGYILMLLGFLAQGMHSKKLLQLEEKLMTGITNSKMWHGFSKDIGYLRRLMNEIYLEKLKPVFRDEEFATPPIIHRSKSLPDLPTYKSEDELALEWKHRNRTKSENLPSLTRVFSEGDLQRIDRNKTFAATAAIPTTFELMRRVIDVYAGQNMMNTSSEESTEESGGLRGVDGFSDEEVLASEYDTNPTITVTSRHPSSIFQLPSYEDTVSRRPHRGRAMSECPSPEREFPVTMDPSGASDWTWSGPAANKLHDVIKQKQRQKLMKGLNARKASMSEPRVSTQNIPSPLSQGRLSASDETNISEGRRRSSVISNNLRHNLAVPTIGIKRSSLQERRTSHEVPRDPHYMTTSGAVNSQTSKDLLQMYSRGDTLFDGGNRNDMFEETSIADFLRALTSLHSRVGEHLVRVEEPKPRRKLGTASLTPPRIRSLLDLFEPPTPRPSKKRKGSTNPSVSRSDGKRDSMVPGPSDDKPDKSESSHIKRFGRFLLRSYSIVPKDMEEVAKVKAATRKRLFSLWPSDTDKQDLPFQLQVDSPPESRRHSLDVSIPMEGGTSRRSSSQSLQKPQPDSLTGSAESVFARKTPPSRRISHPRWHMDSSLSDVKEGKELP